MRFTILKNLIDFPKYRQTFSYDCGAKCLQAVLAYYGYDVSEKEIMEMAGTNSRSGTSIVGLKKVARKFKLKYKARKMTLENLKKYINKKIPVIITIQAWPKKACNLKKSWTHGHYVIPIGYDKKRIYFEDPSSILRTYLTFKELEERWHDRDYGKRSKEKLINFGIAIYGKPVFGQDKIMHMENDAYSLIRGFFKIKRYKRIR